MAALNFKRHAASEQFHLATLRDRPFNFSARAECPRAAACLPNSDKTQFKMSIRRIKQVYNRRRFPSQKQIPVEARRVIAGV